MKRRASLSPVCLLASALVLVAGSLAAQSSDGAAPRLHLTIDTIMRGPGLVGYPPTAVRWLRDSSAVYFEWKRYEEPSDAERATYVVRRDGTGLRRLTEQEADAAPPWDGDLSADKQRTVYARRGDLYVYEHNSARVLRLTRTAEEESQPRFTRDGKHVSYLRAGNLYKLSLETGTVEQLTEFLPAAAPRDPREEEKKGTPSQEFLKQEERRLLRIVGERAKKKEEELARLRRENPRVPYRLAERQRVEAVYLAPDESYAVVFFESDSREARRTVVPDYVTESGYTAEIASRTKVGDMSPERRAAVVRLESGKVEFLDDWLDASWKLSAAAPQPQSGGDATGNGPAKRNLRAIHFSTPRWSEDGARLAMLARSADNKDRWVLAIEPEKARIRPLAHLRDEAWVDGPGASLLGWLKDNRTLYFQSEATGWSHLYTVDFEGGEPKALTSGAWEVKRVELSEDGRWFYLETSEAGAGEWQLYRMAVEGGERLRLTTESGKHEAVLSPDGTLLAVTYSCSNRPPELFLQENRPGGKRVQVTRSPAPEFFTYPWSEPQLVHFRARDGALVPARLYKPADFPKGGPAVIFVHGAGYLQNAHRWWSDYYREYMFHHYLMEHGYLVLDIDYRGSAGYGRDWRTAIYRHMGGKDLDDQVDGARWLVAEHGVDPARIGIYGGSYGGFLTLMALFTAPDVFAAGASLRPVTDWAHYNHGYTSNILNVPQEDAEAYRRSSPIYFAEGLKGALLICHGMVDTNVHFQDTVRLVQRLIELGKENWELAVYPVEGHGFTQPSSWADEYKRIFRLFEAQLKRPTPPPAAREAAPAANGPA